MKSLIRALFIVMAAGMLLSASPIHAREIKQQKCPIMGYKPSEKLFVDYKGKRVYFCCGSCPSIFMKDPERYMEKMKKEGIFLEDSPGAEVSGTQEGKK